MNDFFDTTFTSRDRTQRARHGMPWTREELKRLESYFHEGFDLKDLCEALERPAKGVVPKLEQAGLIQLDGGAGEYRRTVTVDRNVVNHTKETPMNVTGPITVETLTTVNGKDIRTLSDAQIYSLIASEEDEIDELSRIKRKPKRLQAEIARRQAGIDALVEYLDSQTAN